jgi:hypothetical protein
MPPKHEIPTNITARQTAEEEVSTSELIQNELRNYSSVFLS